MRKDDQRKSSKASLKFFSFICWCLGFLFKGLRWLQPSFDACNIHSWLVPPTAHSCPWHMSHNSGISNILGCLPNLAFLIRASRRATSQDLPCHRLPGSKALWNHRGRVRDLFYLVFLLSPKPVPHRHYCQLGCKLGLYPAPWATEALTFVCCNWFQGARNPLGFKKKNKRESWLGLEVRAPFVLLWGRARTPLQCHQYL